MLTHAISGSKGGKGGGGSGVAASEDPNTLRSNSTARFIDLISEGECVGLVNGAASIFLVTGMNGTPLADPFGNFNFTGVKWHHREGLPDQDYMEGFSAAEDEVVENVRIRYGTPVIRTYQGPIDAVRVTAELPALNFSDMSTGKLTKTSVNFKLSKRPSGTATWTDVYNLNINGKCVSPYEQSYRLELGGNNSWDVKYERLTTDADTIKLNNQTFWSTTTLITDGKFQYNNCAYVGFAVDAQQFGSSIPVRAYDYKGLIIEVPSNYDPETRVYTGNWDGTFKAEWTDNPAWVLYAVLTNKRWGIGEAIDASKVDKWGLYQIAQYCDELVPDGFGGFEPRYTFNYQFLEAMDAYKMAQTIASSFRGLVFWSSGMVRVFADMPSDPVKLVSPSNVKGGLFTYEGVAFSAKHSVAVVTWYDPENLCKPAIEVVEDRELIAKIGRKVIPLFAVGCISRGRAHRLGKWALDTEKNSAQTVNYEAAWDHIDASPGEIIEIYDPDYQSLRLGGRVSTATSNSVTIDAPITLEDAREYTLRIVYPNGSLASRLLNNSSGQAITVLTFDQALDQLPVAGAQWGLSTTSLQPRQFRILVIDERPDNFYSVSAIFHDPTKYDRIEQDIELEPPVYTPYQNYVPSAPVNLACAQYVYNSNGTPLLSATFSWTKVDAGLPLSHFEAQLMPPGQNWGDVIALNGPSYDIEGIEPGTWTIRVRAIGFNGMPSAWTTLQSVISGSLTAPPDIAGFGASLQGQILILSWVPSEAADHDHCVIKYSPNTSGATWASAYVLKPDVKGATVAVEAMPGTYLIKNVSTSGTESNNAASVASTVSAFIGIDVVATIDESPTWSGTKENTVVADGVLRLAVVDGVVATSGTYQFSTYDFGAVCTSRLSPLIDAQGENLTNVMASWPRLADVLSLAGSAPSDWNIKLYIRTTQDDPGGLPTWTAWLPFYLGDYTCRAFEVKAELISHNQNVNVAAASLTIQIGMARRSEYKVGLTTLTTGELSVSVTPNFYDVPAYVFNPHDAPSSSRISIASKTKSGCTLSVYNSGGSRIAVTGDLSITGRGAGV